MRDLVQAILEQYQLDPLGTHGLVHWARVCSNGLYLSDREGIDTEVVELFALLHDACRWDEGQDHEHGLRAETLAMQFRGQHFDLGDADFELLLTACRLHSEGLLHADPVVEVCWDADRLDLSRIHVQPMPGLLCTASGRAIALGDDELPPCGEDAFLANNWGVTESGEILDDLLDDFPGCLP